MRFKDLSFSCSDADVTQSLPKTGSSRCHTMLRKTASERSTCTMSSWSKTPMREPMVSRGTVTILSIMICELC